jgi:hypothetical protein
MGQIIKQPNGKYAIWSKIVTDITWFDLTREELIEAFVEEARVDIERQLEQKLALIDQGKPAYFQYTLTWEEALKERDELHGKESREFDDRGTPLEKTGEK